MAKQRLGEANDLVHPMRPSHARAEASEAHRSEGLVNVTKPIIEKPTQSKKTPKIDENSAQQTDHHR
jgi:hypothetical protein